MQIATALPGLVQDADQGRYIVWEQGCECQASTPPLRDDEPREYNAAAVYQEAFSFALPRRPFTVGVEQDSGRHPQLSSPQHHCHRAYLISSFQKVDSVDTSRGRGGGCSSIVFNPAQCTIAAERPCNPSLHSSAACGPPGLVPVWQVAAPIKSRQLAATEQNKRMLQTECN